MTEATRLIGEGHGKLIDSLVKAGRPWERWADELRESLRYYSYSKVFGWTPEQIDGLGDEWAFRYDAMMTGEPDPKVE